MKIAELFVALGIKAPGVQATLDKVDATLRTSATNAGALVAGLTAVQNALAGLSGVAQQTNKNVTQASQSLVVAQQQQAKAAKQTAQAVPPNIWQYRIQQYKDATRELGKMTAAVTALNAVMVILARTAMQTGVTLKNFAVQTGLSTDNLQQWAYNAKLNDQSAQDLIGTLKQLQTLQAQIATGQVAPTAAWTMLGIAPSDDPFTVFEKLSEHLKQMPVDMARMYAAELGITEEGFVTLLAQQKKLEEQYKINKREQQNLIGVNRAWNELSAKFAAFRDRLVAALVPPLEFVLKAITKLLDAISAVYDFFASMPVVGKAVAWFMGFLGANVLLLVGALTALVGLLGAVALGLKAWALASGAVTTILPLLSTAISGLTASLGGLAAAFGVVAVKAAVVVGALVVVQDIVAYLTGGKSVFGDLAEQIDKLGGAGWSLTRALGPFGELLANARMFKSVLEWIANLKLPEWMTKLFGGKTEVEMKSRLPEMVSTAITPKPVGGSNSVTQTNQVEINVDGASDPKAVGREVDRNFKQTLADAAYQIPIPSY